ncbi:MAG: hypothetical protein OEO77_02780 [Acidimicrobiia bacterium]|nr:hypothetical protein [Acidimicrobiia bacterium]
MRALWNLAVVAVLLGACASPTLNPSTSTSAGSSPSTISPAARSVLAAVGDGLVVRRLASGGFAGAVMSDLVVYGDGRVDLAGFDGVPFEGQIAIGRAALLALVAELDDLGAYDTTFEPINDHASRVADGIGVSIELGVGAESRIIDAYALGEAPDAYPEALRQIDGVLLSLMALIETAGPTSGPPSTPGTIAAIRGNLHIAGGAVRLCDGLAESVPPQCAADNVLVLGLEADIVDLSVGQGVRWSDGRVVLVGVWTGSALDLS